VDSRRPSGNRRIRTDISTTAEHNPQGPNED
jgi:hypothetical protein